MSILTFEAVNLTVSFSNVKDFDSLIFASRNEPIAIDGVPSYLVDCVVVCRNRVHSFASSTWVPNLDMIVFTTCND